MSWLLRLLPRSLTGRVFALYSACLLGFVMAGLGSFYYYQFTQAINEALESSALTAEVIAPTVTDSVVIGDYDTVQRTLSKVTLHPVYAAAEFIDLKGGVVASKAKRGPDVRPPDWLNAVVTERLFEVNKVVAAGGRDYGVLRLKLSPEHIASEIWTVTRNSLAIATIAFILGVLLIRVPLLRWVGNLDRIRAFEWEFQTGLSNPKDLLAMDVPLEIRQTFDVLHRTAASLQIQRARADVTLGAIVEGVITTDNHGNIVYANPVATRIFQLTDSPVGLNLRAALPAQIIRTFDEQTRGASRLRRVELDAGEGGPLVIECSWRQIAAAPDKPAGYVMTCRDVTETHQLEQKLRTELESREAALDSLRKLISGLQDGSDPQFAAADDIAGMVRFIGELNRERTRVSNLLETSVRELSYQKLALDAHSIVTIADAGGAITYANEKFMEISGFSAAELIGQNHRIIKSGVHSPQFFEEMWRTIRAGNVWHGQIASRRKDGAIYWAASTIVPCLDDRGRPYQYIAIRTDITDQKAIEHALEEARKRELEIGTAIQRSLLQGDVPDGVNGAWLACSTEPSQGIDGDFYAIHSYHATCFEILVGDVMGKGVPAALIGAAIKTAYNQVLAELMTAHASNGTLPSPAEIVNRLHRMLTPRLVGLSSFATLALYRFDLDTGRLTYVNAGHTQGLLTRSACGTVTEIHGDNLPIGVLPEEQYTESQLAFDSGDCLVVFSDGITEARNSLGEEFGLQRLSALLELGRRAQLPPAALLQSIRGALRGFEGDQGLVDDQTALAVELHPRRHPVRGRPAERANPFLFNLPWRMNALASLRAHVEDSAWFLPEHDAHALVLATFEAATNILRHAPPLVANPTLTCRIKRDQNELAVELIYPCEAFHPTRAIQPDFTGNSDGGFGLFIIKESVDAVEYAELVPGIGSIRLVKRASESALPLPA